MKTHFLRCCVVAVLLLSASCIVQAHARDELSPQDANMWVSAPLQVLSNDVESDRDSDGEPAQLTTQTSLLLVAYCAAIVAASIFGGWLPSLVRLTHTRMQTIISFVGGLMLGIAVFHLLPHSLHGGHSADETAWWLMCGILTMFLLIRCFHFHHHGPLEISTAVEEPCAGLHDHDHDHDDAHGHSRFPADQPHCHHAHQLSWMGIAIGLSLHTLIDGMALAASVQAKSASSAFLSLSGFGTFLAIMLHKPLDAVSITSLMAGSGWRAHARLLVNLGFSAMCPLGALLFVLGISQFSSLREDVISAALAFSAGVFLCISLSDLLPEMEFHAHNRLRLTAALLGGILLAYGITFLEPGHLH